MVSPYILEDYFKSSFTCTMNQVIQTISQVKAKGHPDPARTRKCYFFITVNCIKVNYVKKYQCHVFISNLIC